MKSRTMWIKDAYSCYVLFLLPMLIKPVIIKKTKCTGVWKPSRIEMSFICHVKVFGEIRVVLERKQKKLASLGLTLQPTPIFVSQDLLSIERCYVSIDNILYEVPTPLKAVDVTFCVIHALNACYPKEAEQIWLILEKAIYEHNTAHDRKFAAVNGLLSMLKE